MAIMWMCHIMDAERKVGCLVNFSLSFKFQIVLTCNVEAIVLTTSAWRMENSKNVGKECKILIFNFWMFTNLVESSIV